MTNDRIRDLADQIQDKSDALKATSEELKAKAAALKEAVSTVVVRVKPGDNVSAAFQQLQLTAEGGTILCQPGLYPNALVGITRDPQAPRVIVTTDNATDLPKPGERVTRDHQPGLAMFSAPSGCTYTGQNRSGNLAFVAVGFGPVPDVSRTLVSLGGDRHTLKTVDDLPSELDFERCLFLGQPGRGQHRALQVHARAVRIRQCAGYDFIELGREAQAIAAWNGGLDVEMEDCDWEAGAQCQLIGGGDPASADLIPARWRITRTRFAKDPAWRDLVNAKSYMVKCLVEHKCGIDFVYDGCLLEHAWPDDWAGGGGFVLKVSQANDAQDSPWIVTRGIRLTNSRIHDVDRPFILVGYGDGGKPTQRLSDVTIRNVLATEIRMEGFHVANPPDNLTVDHLTMLGNRPTFFNFWFDQGQPPGSKLTWTNSIMLEGRYGAKNQNGGPAGYAGLEEAFTDCTFTNNLIGGTRSYPGNTTVRPEELTALLDADYRVQQEMGITAATTDGKPVGADVEAIQAAMTY